MPRCVFVTDLHGMPRRYESLFTALLEDPPEVVLLGGDLLPHAFSIPTDSSRSWVDEVLAHGFLSLRRKLESAFPKVLLILGNDDGKGAVPEIEAFEREELWIHLHGRRVDIEGIPFYGYAYVPPTPFTRKDWERYDVSRFTPVGCISPEEGRHLSPDEAREARHRTIQEDLERLAGEDIVEDAVFLFHGPPHETKLDRAGVDGKMLDHVPLDLHVGSIAVRRFLERKQPRLSLHGHVHESARIMGDWRDRLGMTLCLGGAHDGPELALIRFDTEHPETATREFL